MTSNHEAHAYLGPLEAADHELSYYPNGKVLTLALLYLPEIVRQKLLYFPHKELQSIHHERVLCRFCSQATIYRFGFSRIQSLLVIFETC